MTTSTFTPDRQAFREMLATLAAKTKTKIPALNGRVEKALRLALAGDVELHDDGTATVYSSSDPTRRYEIREGTCTCRDYEQAPQQLCQHRLSAGLVRRTQELLPPVPVDPEILEPWADNDAEEPVPQTPPALPEAPASCNVYVQISGHKVQVTLRDSDEQRMLARLQTLLAQYPAPEAPAQGQPRPATDATPQCKYHGPMKASTKAPGTFYCTKKHFDGSYCRERYPHA